MALSAAPRLAEAARRRGWGVVSLDRPLKGPPPDSEIVFYGSTLEAAGVAEKFGLALLEPPLDLLARLPPSLLLRRVGFGRWADVSETSEPVFLKPADPLDKVFDAGVYRGRGQIRTHAALPPDTPVLSAEPVEWLAEYRCFILEGAVLASSPYLSFGRSVGYGTASASVTPQPVLEVCRRLFGLSEPPLPPAYVVDIGLIENRGWAVVEFNPAWCSGLRSANAELMLDMLRRSCQKKHDVTPADSRWVMRRGGVGTSPPPIAGNSGCRNRHDDFNRRD
jgi:hypothetical protein